METTPKAVQLKCQSNSSSFLTYTCHYPACEIVKPMGVHPACSSAVTASSMGVPASVVCLTVSKQGCSLGKFQSVSLLRHLDREEESTFSDHSSALFGCQTLLYKVTYSDTLCGLPTCIPGEVLGNPRLIPVSELGSRLL